MSPSLVDSSDERGTMGDFVRSTCLHLPEPVKLAENAALLVTKQRGK
jgi:hypothetical protein